MSTRPSYSGAPEHHGAVDAAAPHPDPGDGDPQPVRNLGGSTGISILVATLAQNTQVVHSRLVEGLRPDNPLAQAPYLAAPFSLTNPGGIAALNAEVTRQAAMVAYIDDFKLIMLIALASIPLLLLLRDKDGGYAVVGRVGHEASPWSCGSAPVASRNSLTVAS